MRFKLLVLFVLVMVAGPMQSPAQSYDVTNVKSTADLGDGRWYFKEGDDAGWSRANLDDTQWKVVDPKQNLSSYADIAHNRVFWYRLHLTVDPAMVGAAVGVYSLSRAYSVYANGQVLLQRGGEPGHEWAMYNPVVVLRLPHARSELPAAADVNSRQGQDAGSNTVVLAIRCVLMGNARVLPRPLVAPGKLTFGDYGLLEESRRLGLLSTDVPYWVLLLLEVTVGLLALSLYWTQREQRDYLWIALLALDQGLTTLLICVGEFGPVSRDFFGIFATLLDAGLMLGLLGFYMAFAHRRFDLWARVVCVCAGLNICVGILNAETVWMPDTLATLLLMIYYSPLTLFPFFSLVRAMRQGDREARLMLLPFTALALEFYLRIGSSILAGLGVLKDVPAVVGGFTVLFLQLNSRMSVGFFFWVAVLALVVLRSNRLSREHARIAGEVEAARQVQQVLLPDPTAQVPGFETESVYLPASQVGGDFFQLLPTTTDGQPDGGLLVVVGDVAGKGLSAAMLVSVLVGAIRAEAAHGTEPDKVLAALNQTLLGQARGGFATCLCARIGADGEMTIANAGHLPPYLDGREISMAGALPVGIVAGVSYECQQVSLTAGSRLTFYSDGVPEAQNEAGELLGFDRAEELSTQAAETIAQTASKFGQTDDITVLAVRWVGTAGRDVAELAA